MTPVVQRAAPTDARTLALVHLETVTAAYKVIFPAGSESPTLDSLIADWEMSFVDPTSSAFVLDDSGSRMVIGTVGTKSDPEFEGCGQLLRLHVLPDQWGGGFGTLLHDAALDEIRRSGYDRAGLWVLRANPRARRFYECRGWALVPGETLQIHGPGSLEVRYERVVE